MAEQTAESEFLKDQKPEEPDVLTQEVAPEETPEAPKEEPEEEEQPSNRQERRLRDRLQRAREEAIALNERLRTITESQKERESAVEADYLKTVERIYGNKTPEAAEATEVLKQALTGLHKAARDEAERNVMSRLEAERAEEEQSVAKEEENLDTLMDEVEDEYHLNFGDDKVRKGYLNLLEKMSPKDRDGNIIEYADGFAVAESYLATREKPANRAKQLASRSMTQSAESNPEKQQQDATVALLKEHGILDW